MNLEEQYKNKNIRNFYQEAKKRKQKNKGTMQYCRNEDGELIGEANEKAKCQIPSIPTEPEIKEVAKNLVNNKSPGEIGISVELLKEGGQTSLKCVSNIIQEILRTEKIARLLERGDCLSKIKETE